MMRGVGLDYKGGIFVFIALLMVMGIGVPVSAEDEDSAPARKPQSAAGAPVNPNNPKQNTSPNSPAASQNSGPGLLGAVFGWVGEILPFSPNSEGNPTNAKGYQTPRNFNQAKFYGNTNPPAGEGIEASHEAVDPNQRSVPRNDQTIFTPLKKLLLGDPMKMPKSSQPAFDYPLFSQNAPPPESAPPVASASPEDTQGTIEDFTRRLVHDSGASPIQGRPHQSILH